MKPEYSPAQLENIRQRLNPSVKDVYYLVLADLRLFLQRYATAEPISVLDYGAGNSPYASLFPNAEYRRADYMDCTAIDYKVDGDSRLPVASNTFDLVWSTQVAEHVQNPSTYFSEALRVLKPGGRLVVTTHGVWEDHGVPYDFQRWTAEGLQRDLELAGFSVKGTFKITTSGRFYWFLLLQWLEHGGLKKTNLSYRLWRRFCWEFAKFARPIAHRFADWRWSDCQVIEGEALSQHRIYSVIAAEAIKPLATDQPAP
ncbi:class I SAM-dependent methyltransferase [Roseimicrobium sp. ORNL1]|uniref:class I SAM-dependent methyltransferase n=1 Tax=Roseimicrobium sp. ORNL1 TaxID=2711231 RepID=UPI0013E16AD8|nr:class I SAM-dependent methyltransferase [Roseimicrobium sp. ORNL1]QIF04476.1 class I SAM-dependent methyltransferase [Roseimicrobium sp. ORNL1]